MFYYCTQNIFVYYLLSLYYVDVYRVALSLTPPHKSSSLQDPAAQTTDGDIHCAVPPLFSPSGFTPHQVATTWAQVCLLKELRPVSRTVTNLDCVLLKDNNRAPVARSGPEINSRAWLCVQQGPRHNTRCCLSTQHFIFLLIFCLETSKKSSGPMNRWTKPSLVSLSKISFPHISACPGTQYSPTVCRVEISFNAFWHYRTNGDVLAAWSTFRGTKLSDLAPCICTTDLWYISPQFLE